MTVRRMTPEDLSEVIDWAAAEGWNPGLDDAEAFFAADPQGFFVKEVADEMVAAVSVVNHDAAHAFLGLYICLSDHRGQGHGIEVWNAAVAHAGNRCIGLDGVPDQQANYIRSGFAKYGKNTRFCGQIDPQHNDLRAAQPNDLDALLQVDARVTGIDRKRFADTWFTNTKTRQTLILSLDESPSFSTYRLCREGVKIGPFVAQTAAQADTLLSTLPQGFAKGTVFVDVPDSSADLCALLVSKGFQSVFETARMYKGIPPKTAPPPFYGVATLELG